MNITLRESRLRRHLIGASLSLMVLSASAPAEAKSFLWKITRGGRTSYLMGSIHMGKKSFYPLAPAIRRAFKKSNVLVMEARPDRLLGPMVSMFRHGIYLPPDSLKKHVSAKTYKKVLARAKTLGLPAMAIDRFRPWMLAMTLIALDMQKLGYDPNLGVEMVLMSKAGKRKIDVLEGMEFQMKLFSGFSDSLQELFLLYSLEQGKQAGKMMKKMVRAWKRGDTRTLARIMSKYSKPDPRYKVIEKKLIDDRNVSMAKTIHKMLSKSSDVHFFVVGAGHLVGKTSMVKQLHKLGYLLKQL
jgi:uncharacterized protein YbaP (TraB family)